MKVLSLGGAGAVCQHATRDLAEFSDFDQIVIGDYNVAAAEKLAEEIGDPRVQVLKVDAEDYDGLVKTFEDFDDTCDTGDGTFVIAQITVLPSAPDWIATGRLRYMSRDTIHVVLFHDFILTPEPGAVMLLMLGGLAATHRRSLPGSRARDELAALCSQPV